MHRECLFLCLIMKALFRKYNKFLPIEFQSVIEQLELKNTVEDIRFSNKIIEAVEILIDYEISNAHQIDDRWNVFQGEIRGLHESFECRRFLNICVHYLTKAFDDYLIRENIDSLVKVHDDLLDVLKKSKVKGVFNAHSWVELSDVAEEIISQDEINRLRKGKQFIESKKHLHEFVLRIMNFVFQSNFKDLPLVLQEILNAFPENQDVRFAPTVRAAVVVLMNDGTLPSKRVGVEYADCSEGKSTSLSEEIRFLKDSVSYSKTALSDYCENNNTITAWEVFQYLMKDLTNIADYLQQNSILWNQMVRAALFIITNYKKRNQETNIEKSLTKSKFLTSVNDLYNDSDSSIETKECCSCKCDLQ